MCIRDSLVIRTQFFGIQPYALAHQERVVAHALAALDAETVEQLVDYEVDLAVEILEEPVQIAVAADCDCLLYTSRCV